MTLPLIAHVAGYRGAFVFAAAIVAVTTFIAYFGYREQRDDDAPATTLGSVVRGMHALARDPRLIGVTLTCMVLVSAQSALNAFFTVTGVAVVGTSAAVAALAFACAQGAAVCGRLAWGYLSDRVLDGERLIPFAVICMLAAIGAAAVALMHVGTVVVLFGAAIVLGLSAAGWNGLMAATISEVGGSERAASALGITLTAIFLTSSVAPIPFGALADHTSLRIAWFAIAALAVLGVAGTSRCRAAGTPVAGAEPRSVRAQVAELVDALVSGISDRKVVGVRVPSWAPSRQSPAHRRCAGLLSRRRV